MPVVRRIALAAVLALTALAAEARDGQLEADMVALEKLYIGPLFHTSNQNLARTNQTFPAFVQAWNGFAASYRTYRPNHANWGVHFEAIDEAVSRTEAAIVAARAVCSAVPAGPGLPPPPCPALVAAHELEVVRLVTRELRRHNGFPRFITDKLTAYHEPMEALVLAVKGRTADQIDDALLETLREGVEEADFLWRVVERTPVADAWGFTAAQLAEIDLRIGRERAALEAFADAVALGDRAALSALGMALKQAFVPVYTAFSSDPALNKLPLP